MDKHKLSASALSTFLRSPKAFFWRYIKQLEPLTLSVSSYDHDKLAGIIWAECVDRFYKGVPEAQNSSRTLQDWLEQTEGWVPPKPQEKLTKALEAWCAQYYQQFRPDDGCRTPEQSELFVENERFVGYLDGLSAERVIHEVKSTSRSPQLSEQLLKVQSSIQVKLYAVLTQATGVCIEFAWKDSPYQIFRAPVLDIRPEQLVQWEQELNALADSIYALGTDEYHYPCHTDGCTIMTKNFAGSCSYQMLCLSGITEETKIGFKPKTHRK